MRVNCAKHKRHVAPNSFVNLLRNSTVYCFVASGLLYSSIKEKKKVATSDMKLATTKSALLIFPAGCPASIFSANELNYRVRDGNGWTLVAINTDA